MDPEPRVGGGGSSRRPKKKVTPTKLRVEMVSDLPVAIVATSDEFEMCPCPGENVHTMNSNAKLFRRNSVDDKWHPNLVLLPSTSTLPSPHRPKPSGSAHLLSLRLITVFPLTYLQSVAALSTIRILTPSHYPLASFSGDHNCEFSYLRLSQKSANQL